MKRAILSLYLFLVHISILFVAFSVYMQPASVFAAGTITGSAGRAGSGVCKGSPPECNTCFDNGGAWTVFGCIGEQGDPGSFVEGIIKIGVGLGGGIAFLLILVSGFQTITSGANPEKLHAAQEVMTAAISGLLLIIFSVFLLRLIGVDILQIPGLS